MNTQPTQTISLMKLPSTDKYLVFDAGPIISLALNNLLWTLKPLKEQFGGRFLISKPVLDELILTPLRIHRFEFEALQTLSLVKEGILEVIAHDEELRKAAGVLMNLANDSFVYEGRSMKIVHEGEMSSLAIALKVKADAYVIDERNTRMLIESPLDLKNLLEKKLHTKIDVKRNSIAGFSSAAKISVLRSSELVLAAYKLGLLDKFVPDKEYARECAGPDMTGSGPKRILLNSALWAVKLNGCAIPTYEIERVVKRES